MISRLYVGKARQVESVGDSLLMFTHAYQHEYQDGHIHTAHLVRRRMSVPDEMSCFNGWIYALKFNFNSRQQA